MRLESLNEASAETHHAPVEVAPQRADMEPGTELAGYRIEAVVGRGGMGVVYRATHLHMNRIVALKVLGVELVDDPEFRERFLRESRAAASISHRGMVTAYDAGEADGQLYIAMQYVDGTDLGALLRAEGALEPPRVVSLLRQIAGALDIAHERGIVHRDVKPANVLIDGEECFLTDFGLTKQISSETALTANGQFVGTVHYMAPEQVEGAAVDAQADLYGLGCVAFHSLTGSPPFDLESDVSVAMAHLKEPPPSLMAVRPDLPTGLDAVLSRALAKHKQDRQSSCRELVDELEAALRGAPAEAVAKAEGGRLLVAAQDPATRAVVRASLKGRGLRVLEAADPASAVEIARREQPELAIVDWDMAAAESGDIRDRLRDFPETAEIKIVTMATYEDADEGGRVALGGDDDWISKPFSPLQLIHKIRQVSGLTLDR
jgi:serine/threonine-protein kinase